MTVLCSNFLKIEGFSSNKPQLNYPQDFLRLQRGSNLLKFPSFRWTRSRCRPETVCRRSWWLSRSTRCRWWCSASEVTARRRRTRRWTSRNLSIQNEDTCQATWKLYLGTCLGKAVVVALRRTVKRKLPWKLWTGLWHQLTPKDRFITTTSHRPNTESTLFRSGS